MIEEILEKYVHGNHGQPWTLYRAAVQGEIDVIEHLLNRGVSRSGKRSNRKRKTNRGVNLKWHRADFERLMKVLNYLHCKFVFKDHACFLIHHFSFMQVNTHK